MEFCVERRGGQAGYQLHQDETVIPAELATAYREGAKAIGAGGGMGGGLTINIQAWDGADVRRVVESQDFRRAFREATRNGRL